MDELETALERLVARAVLDCEQAAAVREEVGALQPPARRIGPVVEIVGYLGGVLAAVASVALVSQFWASMQPWARVATVALTAAGLWLAGRAIWPAQEPAAERLVGALWFLSVAAAGGAAGLTGSELLGLSGETTTLAAGGVTAVYAGVLWATRRQALQLLALYAATLTTVAGLFLLPERPPDDWAGLVGWAVGVAWALLVWGGVLRPPRAGYAMSAVTVLVGAQILGFSYETAGMLLGLATSGALLVASRPVSQPLLVAAGSIGLVLFVPQSLSLWFPGSINAPAAVFVAGVVLLGGALATIRASRATHPAQPTRAAE